MPRIVLTPALVTAALAFSLQAQAASLTRTFISSAGMDTNACTVTAPCRTLAGAYANTAANGIIAALDPAGYGPLTITGPVTIDGNGWAAISAPANGNGITISAGSSDKVVLRGLTIDGGGVANNRGILVNSVGSLVVDGTVVRGTVNAGLAFFPSGAATLAVSNSAFDGTGDVGMRIANVSSGSNAMTAAIDQTEFNNNSIAGLAVDASSNTGAVTVAVTGSVAANTSGGGSPGFAVSSVPSEGAANLTLTTTLAVGNPIGVTANGQNATLWLTQSTVTGNTTGFSVTAPAVIKTFSNNYIADNGSNTGSLTPASQQ